MKYVFGKYPDRMVCNLHRDHIERRYGITAIEGEDYEPDIWDKTISVLDDWLQNLYNWTFNYVWLDRRKHKIKVKIDYWDTWSMDYALAPLILPMLKQLKGTKHGSPMVDNEDVPEEFHCNDDYIVIDDNHHERWDWVLDEMIWVFEEIASEDAFETRMYEKYLGVDGYKNPFENPELKQILRDYETRQKHALTLFGKYFRSLWD